MSLQSQFTLSQLQMYTIHVRKGSRKNKSVGNYNDIFDESVNHTLVTRAHYTTTILCSNKEGKHNRKLPSTKTSFSCQLFQQMKPSLTDRLTCIWYTMGSFCAIYRTDQIQTESLGWGQKTVAETDGRLSYKCSTTYMHDIHTRQPNNALWPQTVGHTSWQNGVSGVDTHPIVLICPHVCIVLTCVHVVNMHVGALEVRQTQQQEIKWQ